MRPRNQAATQSQRSYQRWVMCAHSTSSSHATQTISSKTSWTRKDLSSKALIPSTPTTVKNHLNQANSSLKNPASSWKWLTRRSTEPLSSNPKKRSQPIRTLCTGMMMTWAWWWRMGSRSLWVVIAICTNWKIEGSIWPSGRGASTRN
jgi:hypothetical protein